ncbi:hypothetical protein GUITHDRAFT_115922 [Guillardia theta CCMP2712]|uniref:Serine aminopeptidase S33 domain-containing protein n=1 Tax=Guillardia theta (strain CCMP2712) TaxID=905079 RepID=L1INT7_GUITC|nr:hypothetical protein GUITHDRAFT_115922 [Guillardia theta CCMP2712]EKX37951.1 hypothetical protein GUITHDRAFT_115922 [Guillardia theta CCMP2712]|eukprot:XP_005824931.1 hypothetical protein GUITHDRAFT_115922 [Guillardia theta CCMP2712]
MGLRAMILRISLTLSAMSSIDMCCGFTGFSHCPFALRSGGRLVSSYTHKKTQLSAARRLNTLSSGVLSLKAEEKFGRGLKAKMKEGHSLVYDYVDGSSPVIVYLPAFNQSRITSKSSALQTWAKRNGKAFFSADYYGCGKSDGKFEDGTLTMWTNDMITLIEDVIKKPVLLVGSGVGGWVGLHLAMKRKNLVPAFPLARFATDVSNKVRGLVGIAADPDFTTDVVLPELDDTVKEKIQKDGSAMISWGVSEYTISKKFIDDSKNMLLLPGGSESLDIKCPVRLIQGLSDEEIPPDRALRISEAIKSDDVVVYYVKDGDHFLDQDEDISRMIDQVQEMCSKYFEFDLTSPGSG